MSKLLAASPIRVEFIRKPSRSKRSEDALAVLVERVGGLPDSGTSHSFNLLRSELIDADSALEVLTTHEAIQVNALVMIEWLSWAPTFDDSPSGEATETPEGLVEQLQRLTNQVAS